jgi:hypothetical protein
MDTDVHQAKYVYLLINCVMEPTIVSMATTNAFVTSNVLITVAALVILYSAKLKGLK